MRVGPSTSLIAWTTYVLAVTIVLTLCALGMAVSGLLWSLVS